VRVVEALLVFLVSSEEHKVLTCYISVQIQAEQDAQGEAQGDPIILEGGDRANVDGLPHSRMLEQVGRFHSSCFHN
jgi:hypothetical protein